MDRYQAADDAAPEDSCSLPPRSTTTPSRKPAVLPSASSGTNCDLAVSLPYQQHPPQPPYFVLPSRPSNSEWTAQQRIEPPAPECPTATMSAVAALHFDPVFSRGGRSSFNSWLGLDSPEASSSYIGPNLTSLGPTSDGSLSPPLTSRSITSSPPRGGMTAQQRELKRQRDQVRRDSKTSTRVHRGPMNPYLGSPPLSVADVTAAMGVYSTAPEPVSLLAEPITTMATSSYMHSYSPPVPEAAYPDQFHQTMPAAYSMGVDYTAQFSAPSHYERSPPLGLADPPMMYGVNPSVSSSASPPSEHSHVRVVQSRPKPQCWEHGCNGRQFSTFSNLLRHQREKSGQAAKATCPNCGAEFTRTTARNGHLLHDKCKQRRNS